MPWNLEFDVQCGVTILTFRTDISNKDVQESNVAATAMMFDNDTRKILTDFTDAVSLAASTFDIYCLPEDYKALGQNDSFTEAIVAPKDSKVRNDVEFYETVCINRGINAQVFEDRQQALIWLSR